MQKYIEIANTNHEPKTFSFDFKWPKVYPKRWQLEKSNVENKILNVSKLVILFKLERLNFIQALFPILEGNKKLKILFIFPTHLKTISCFVVVSSLNGNKMKENSSFFAENCSNERFNWKTLGIITEESHREHSLEEIIFWIEDWLINSCCC